MTNPDAAPLPRILIIDDNPSIHRDFDLVLAEEAGNPELEAKERRVFGGTTEVGRVVQTYVLEHALSGLEGIEKVKQSIQIGNPYQVGFVDVRMPDLNGVETIRRIWQIDPHIQMVICTAYSDYSREDLAQLLGITDKLLVLKKPFDSIEVMQLAGTLAEKWFLGRQAALKLEEMELLVARRTQKVLELQRQESERLRQLDQSKLRFLTTLSHELRTPLALVLGPLEQMMAGRDMDRQQRELMHRNARRLVRLVNQLQDFGKLEAGDLKLHAVEADLVAFLRGVVQLFMPIAMEQKVELRFEVNEEGRRASFDADKLEKILFNLLSHALTFTPEQGRVTVQARFDRSTVEIVVEDTGLGITAAELPFIFDPFHVTDLAGGEMSDRKGVGLALAHQLVRLHGGTISVQSPASAAPTPPNNPGTRFNLVLPIHQPPVLPAEKKPAEPVPELDVPALESAGAEDWEARDNKAPVLLIVGDNADMCAYISQGFTPEFRISGASDIKEGLNRAQDIVPDLIIMDSGAPEGGTIELCRSLKTAQLTSHIPVIVLAGQDSEDDQVNVLRAGADDYVRKPFSLSLLKVRAENLLESRRRLLAHVPERAPLQPRDVATNQADAQFLQRILAAIEQNLSDFEYDVDVLARNVGVSRRQLFRKLKAVVDTTPKALIRSVRLKRAAQLLEESQMTITEITYAVGFSDVKHFRNLFRERFGVAPGEYGERRVSESMPRE